MLEHLCDTLEKSLAEQGIALTRPYRGVVTPTEVRISVISNRLPDAARLSAALGQAVQVYPVPGGFTVSIPHAVRLSSLLSLLRGLHNVPPVTAVLGLGDDGVPTLIWLASPSVQHVQIVGPAGCGKSALLRTIAASLAYFTAGLRIAVSPVPADLARLVHLRQRRGETSPPVVALYDSPAFPVDGLEVALRDGWRWGVHVVLAARHPCALGHLFPVQVESSGPAGDFTVTAPEGRFRFWAAWPDVGTLSLPGEVEVRDVEF